MLILLLKCTKFKMCLKYVYSICMPMYLKMQFGISTKSGAEDFMLNNKKLLFIKRLINELVRFE